MYLDLHSDNARPSCETDQSDFLNYLFLSYSLNFIRNFAHHNAALSACFRLCWTYLLQGVKTPPQNGVVLALWQYTASDYEAPVLEVY